MDVCYRVPVGLHHLPRRVRYSIRHHVWVSPVCEVFPLADERPDGIGKSLMKGGVPSRIADPLLDGPSPLSRSGCAVPRSNDRAVHYIGHSRRSVPWRCNEHDSHGRGWWNSSICQRGEPNAHLAPPNY